MGKKGQVPAAGGEKKSGTSAETNKRPGDPPMEGALNQAKDCGGRVTKYSDGSRNQKRISYIVPLASRTRTEGRGEGNRTSITNTKKPSKEAPHGQKVHRVGDNRIAPIGKKKKNGKEGVGFVLPPGPGGGVRSGGRNTETRGEPLGGGGNFFRGEDLKRVAGGGGGGKLGNFSSGRRTEKESGEKELARHVQD